MNFNLSVSGMETLVSCDYSATLQVDRRLRVFENMVLEDQGNRGVEKTS
jgi:hypothetical protein